MHPFKFSDTIAFTCSNPDSSFIFYPKESNKFHWYGSMMDKFGTYSFFEKDKLYLELEWNYGREQIYTVEFIEERNNGIIKFILKDDKSNSLYVFSK